MPQIEAVRKVAHPDGGPPRQEPGDWIRPEGAGHDEARGPGDREQGEDAGPRCRVVHEQIRGG
jgi:hypothetical protein